MAVAKHNLNGPKANTIQLLRGTSCLNCKYRLREGRTEDESLYLEPRSQRWAYERYHSLIHTHCSLRTDMDGFVRKESILVNETPCKNHWLADPPHRRI